MKTPRKGRHSSLRPRPAWGVTQKVWTSCGNNKVICLATGEIADLKPIRLYGTWDFVTLK